MRVRLSGPMAPLPAWAAIEDAATATATAAA